MKCKIDTNSMDKPVKISLGFKDLIEKVEEIAENGDAAAAKEAHNTLDGLKNKDRLVQGFQETSKYKEHIDDIKLLLGTLFPSTLSNNEIKVAVPPMCPDILFASERFYKVFNDKEQLESLELMHDDPDMMYINMCCFILMKYYGKNLITSNSPVYRVQSKNGLAKYYKSTYNADFVRMEPLSTAPEINDKVINHLIENYSDVKVWKEIFPPDSWILNGFGLRSFTDVTTEEVLSLIKNNLIGNKTQEDKEKFVSQMDDYMATLLDVPDIKTAFSMYNSNSKSFMKNNDSDRSFALGDFNSIGREDLLCSYSMDQVFNAKEAFIVKDLATLPEEAFKYNLYQRLREQDIQSYIMTPLYKGNKLLGVLEFAHNKGGMLNNIHTYRIAKILPMSIEAISKFNDEMENQMTAIIQHEFTAIHPSVSWKFIEEAELALKAKINNKSYSFGDIIFKDLTALYGQVDISGSSYARNTAIAADLNKHISMVKILLEKIKNKIEMPLLDNINYQVKILSAKLSSELAAGMEQEVIEFLKEYINPVLEQIRIRDLGLEMDISAYYEAIGTDMDILYEERKAYDQSVTQINDHLTIYLDSSQEKAQTIYPHYFERYKTDGVEHNMFIGQELTPNIPFDNLYLDNLRLWQLKTICELEIEYQKLKTELPVPLDVASLIMVYSNPIAIKYRLDEKQFDVDGAYNARYEIIKKRIDKSHIKGTTERITKPGYIVLIYTQPTDLKQYQNFISYLVYEGYLEGETELFDIEDLQGVVGLKGIRVKVNFNQVEGESTKVSNNKAKSVAASKLSL